MRPYLYLLVFVVLMAVLSYVLIPHSGAESRYIDLNRIADLYVDTETGVVYYMIRDVRGTTNMMCVCPRYNSNGTLYTWGGVVDD